jgi:hypothetical protein
LRRQGAFRSLALRSGHSDSRLSPWRTRSPRLRPATRRSISPGLIDISLSAYGWSGPWATRRGFDSLVQMSTGIAETGMRWRQSDRPVPLPVQALDHATGYFMAGMAIRAITRRLDEGLRTEARLSLARTAKFAHGLRRWQSIFAPFIGDIGGAFACRRTRGLGSCSASSAPGRGCRRTNGVGICRPKARLSNTCMALRSICLF